MCSASYEESIFKKATIHEFKLVELKEVELSCLKFTTANPIFSMDSITRVQFIIKAVYEYGANRDILKCFKSKFCLYRIRTSLNKYWSRPF